MARSRTCSAGASSRTKPISSARAGVSGSPNSKTSRTRATPTIRRMLADGGRKRQPQVDFVQREAEIALRHDAEIAGNRQDRSTGESVATQRRHHRLGEAVQALI